MARYVVLVPVTVAASGYTTPARVLARSQTLELSVAEVTAIGSANLRAVSTTTMHDTLGEAAGVSNGD